MAGGGHEALDPFPPSSRLPSNPAPAMAEVPALPHGEPSVPKEAKMFCRCFVGERSSLRCRVVFMLPACHPHSTGRGWASTCQIAQANKALSHSLPGNTRAPPVPSFPPLQLEPSEVQGKRKGNRALGAMGRVCSCREGLSPLGQIPSIHFCLHRVSCFGKLPLMILFAPYFSF